MNTKKKTFPMRTTLLLLLMMLTSLSVWANEIFTVGDFTYIVASESSKTVNVRNYSGTMPENYNMVIPASVTNPNNSTLYTVIGIEISAFMDKTNLTSVSIPASMTRINQQAFEGCTNLETVSIPEANGVTDVGDAAFSGTKWLNDQPNGVVYVGKVAYLGKNVSGDISIIDGAVSISDEAFLNCTGLTSVTIPNSVTYIGSSAFGGCTNLTSITIPNGVTEIGGSAFSGCTNLTSVTIPNSVTFIDDGAFQNCTSLTSITIPASVQTIMSGAFYKCTNLKTVTIYAPSCFLGTDAFSGCNDLQIYVFSDLVEDYQGDENWSKYAGIIKGLTGGYCGATGHASDVVWVLTGASPDYTLTISGTGAMQDADFAHSYKMPWDSYKTDITTVVIENGVTSIGQKAFSQHENMTSITIANSVTTIGGQAFNLCKGLTSFTVPNGVTNIDESAFDQCSNMETFHIGTSLATIDNSGIFTECTGLTTFTVNAANDHFKAEGGVLFSKDGTELVAYPAAKDATTYTIPNGVTTIRNYAFDKCTKLTEVTIPSSVATIGNGAFANCTNLATINGHSGVKSVGLNAFFETAWLKGQPDGVGYINNMAIAYVFKSNNSDITIKEGTTTIACGAFRGSPNITSVIIPASVTSIGDGAFSNCISLGTITLLPTTPPALGEYAFLDMGISVSDNKKFYFHGTAYGSNSAWNEMYNHTNDFSSWTTTVIYGATLSSGATTSTEAICGEGTTKYYTAGTTVTLGHETVPDRYVLNYVVKDENDDDITTSVISEDQGVYTLTMPEKDVTVTAWKKDFTKCTADVPDLTLSYGTWTWGSISYRFSDQPSSIGEEVMDGDKVLTRGTDYMFGRIVFYGTETDGADRDSKVGDHFTIEIIGIGDYTGTKTDDFYVISPTVTDASWGNLTWSLDGDGKFNITGTGDMNSAANYSQYPWFIYCSYIKSITIGEGITSVAANAFAGNGTVNPYSSVTSVSLPSTLETIGDYAFAYSGLTSVNIPASVTSIGDGAFNQCTSLESITLNGGVTIGGAAFPTTTNTDVTVTIANDLLLHNGTEPLSGTITDMTKLNGKTLQTTVPYTDDNGDPQSTTIDWATVNEGTQADPYMIYHPAQLLLLAYRVNGTHGETANDYSGKYFKLGANIAFSHEANEGDDYAENYEAIGRCENGSTDYNFKGDFDGDSHTVSGIRLRKTGVDYADWCQGLFGLISTGANIHDVHVTDARILGYKYVSGIVGYIEFGTVSNCTVTETAITATYNNCYGTICGDINSGTLQHNYYRHCTVNGTANATNVGCCRADDSKNDGAMPMYVAYIDANGDEQKCTDYTILDNTMTTISAGWYVVKSDVAFSGDLSTNADGEVNIILCDGATLTASNIDLNGNSDQLCIYGQSQGTGTANISGEIMATCSIQIYGGNISAGTLAVNEGNINLAGATVKADNYGEPKSDVTIATGITYYDGEGHSYTEGNLSADQISAIAGKKLRTYDYRTVSYVKADGTSATVDAIPLKGSTKDVTLGSDGATTWYVVNSDVNYDAITLKGNVNIILCDDKTMTSDGRSASAIRGNNNSLTIYGQTAGTGKLVAQSGEGSGISSGAITINGGNVSATASNNAIRASGNITINGGNVSAKGDSYGIKAGGNITLGWTNANDHIYASSYSETVTIASGLVFTDGNGHNFYGNISDVSAIAGQTLQPAIPYIKADGNTDYCTDFFVIDGRTTYFGNDNGWYVVNSNVTLNGLRFPGNANIILCDGAKLTVKNNNVRGDITAQDLYSASITVYAQSAGTGAIEAGAIEINTSDITGAFITIYGGNVDINRLEAGFVNIYGGSITVNTAENQTKAAIYSEAYTEIYGGSVTVTANGCNGIQSNQGFIHIYGGQVTATATGTGCYGISSGDYIRLRWTKATDFIQASSYNVGQNCDVNICDGQMMSDGTTIYSSYLDAQKDAIAGQKLVPYGFKTKANPHESDYWTSFYYGTANYSAPDGVTIYKAAIDGDHVQLTEVSGGIIRAGEAVILKTTASNVTTDGYLILPLTTTDATGDYSGNELKGVDVDTWQEDGYTYYVLSKKGDNFGFFKLASSNMLGAHKAYLKVDAQNSTREFFGFDDSDSEDGIKSIDNGQLIIDNEAIYNLSGQKLSKPQKGINIINGKKVLF